MNASGIVQREYERIRARVWDEDDGDDLDDALRLLSPMERAVYVTRQLEAELADGGWFLVFANDEELLVKLALEAYGLLGLPRYVAHLREVIEFGLRRRLVRLRRRTPGRSLRAPAECRARSRAPARGGPPDHLTIGRPGHGALWPLVKRWSSRGAGAGLARRLARRRRWPIADTDARARRSGDPHSRRWR